MTAPGPNHPLVSRALSVCAQMQMPQKANHSASIPNKTQTLRNDDPSLVYQQYLTSLRHHRSRASFRLPRRLLTGLVYALDEYSGERNINRVVSGHCAGAPSDSDPEQAVSRRAPNCQRQLAGLSWRATAAIYSGLA